jgi:peptidoglycan hydrolase-like protein with peptidoglycan-binding domain
MLRFFLAVSLLLWPICAAAAGRIDARAVNDAEFSEKRGAEDKMDPAIVRAQVLLDRARFSPGEIDGKMGENAKKALTAFAEANGLNPDKPLNTDIWKKLIDNSPGAAIVDYTIAESDVKGPFLEKLPAKMEDMKDLKALSYSSPREAIAEKFHMSEGLLEALNPGTNFDRAGETISVTNVLVEQPKLRVSRVEVDKTHQTVKALGESGELVGFFPATVGSEEKPTPSGELKVTSVNANPNLPLQSRLQIQRCKSQNSFHNQAWA